MKNTNLTNSETKIVKSLIRLGDSEALAIETVIASRSKNNNPLSTGLTDKNGTEICVGDEIYYQAYCY